MSTGNSRHRVALGFLGAASLVGLGAVTLAAAGAWQGCSIYNSSLLLDASAEGATEGGGPFACAHVTYKPAPLQDDPSGTPNTSFSVAMQTIDLGVGLDGGPIPQGPLPSLGWDLDNVCTCPGEPSCMQGAGTKENCDDDAGRDHTGLQLFRQLGPTAQAGVATANQAMQTGEYGLVIQMTGYNGQPNDTHVSVALYASSGVLGPNGGLPQLAHDGTDKWTLDPRYLTGGQSLIGADASTDCGNGNSACSPIYVDDNAYVADSYVVARSIGEVPITFGGRADIGGAVMDLSQMIIVGKLEPASLAGGGQSWRITDGTISGRWGSQKLLANMATIPDPTSDAGVFLCGSDPAYGFLKQYICSLQDITGNSPDNQGYPCDAISMAFGFTAEPVQLGTVAPLPDTPSGCKQGGVPFHDSCP